MKGIVFLGNRRCEVREFPIPEPGYDEVLIQIKATGICGSDLHVYRSDESSEQIRGHEPCGVVVKVGHRVKHLRVGDRVTVHHHRGCGICAFCAQGEFVACLEDKIYGVHLPGSFAEYMVAAERNCVPLPHPLTFVDGAFIACVGSTAFAALRRLEVAAYDSLAVFGLGPVGLSCVILAKAMGLRTIGVDVIRERVELACQCGADVAINASEVDVVALVREFGKVAGVDHLGGVDHVIETSGNADARRNVIPSLRRGGNAAIVGVGSDQPVINPSDIHAKAVSIIGSVVFPLGWMWELARFMVASRTTFEPAVTHQFALDDASVALRTADEGKCGKVIFAP